MSLVRGACNALLIGLAGCVSPTGSHDGPVSATMSVGQEVVVAPDGISFRLDSIVSDSRCPIDVVCIQAGSVGLKFAVASPAHPTVTTLLVDSAKPDSSSGVILRVTGVDPVRRLNVPVGQAEYRVHLTFGRL